MIFILRGGGLHAKNDVVATVARLSEVPVYRRSLMNVPLLIMRKSTHPHARYIAEVFQSFIGHVLRISECRDIDTRIGMRPGDEPLDDTREIKVLM